MADRKIALEDFKMLFLQGRRQNGGECSGMVWKANAIQFPSKVDKED
jgi:hypothetical protein